MPLHGPVTGCRHAWDDVAFSSLEQFLREIQHVNEGLSPGYNYLPLCLPSILTWAPKWQLVSGGGNVKESWKRKEIVCMWTPFFPPSLSQLLALADKG